MIVTTTNRLQDPAGTVLHVAGELDTYAADELRKHLHRLPAERDSVVLVDLSAVTFMSCTALSILSEARARFGPRLLLDGRSRVVSRLLELTGLTSSFAERVGTGEGPAPDGPAGGADGDPLRTRGAKNGAWTFSRTDVDRVRGLLMAVHGCDAEQAWRMLALAAARHGVPVGELAQLLIRAHQEAPSSAAAAAALTVLMRTPVEAATCGDPDPDPGPAACGGAAPASAMAGGPDRHAERLMNI